VTLHTHNTRWVRPPKDTNMPALVVWEPLIAAGDDLYLLSVTRIFLYLVEIALSEQKKSILI
jgi:hypothetical protein